MLSNKINQLIAEALKARDEVRLSTLRLLSSAFNYEKIEKRRELDDSEELVVIRKQAKQRKDSIEAYKKAGERGRELREAKELEILQKFLPPEMGEQEIEKIIDEIIKPGMQMGQAISIVKAKAPNADGGIIANMVRQKLEL
ncbi:MAG: GatB/YqeY domain-containing protein [Patescibacteria group bacterium]